VTIPPSAWVLPDPALAPAGEDLVAIGGDLEPGTILNAYAQGLFPMDVGKSGPLGWWSPDPRGVLPLNGLRITRSLRSSCRRFEVSIDRDFSGVLEGCGDSARDQGWITDEFVAAYTRLHELGFAHSVEVWERGRLVGGLYGIEVGGLFAGESMFHRQRDTSKVALVALVDALGGDRGADEGRLLDVQWRTPHLGSLGAIEVTRSEYLRLLARALNLSAQLGAESA